MSAVQANVQNAAVTDRSTSPWRDIWPWPTIIAVSLIVLDQVVKLIILRQENLYLEPIEVIPSIFYIVRVNNKGAAWGILAEHTWFLALVSAVVFVYMTLRFRSFTEGWPERTIALSAVLGGIGGNLIDRVFRPAGVIDFLSFRYQSFEWPAFNVADSAICVGVGVFIVSTFLRPETPVSEPSTPEE